MRGIKGDGLISEAQGIISAGTKKGTKAVVREVGKFAEAAKEQIVGGTPPKKPKPQPKLLLDSTEQKKREEERAREIVARLRKLAEREREERGRTAKAQEYYAKLREAELAAGEEEEKRLPLLGALDWFVKMGKKTRGWIFERKRGERKPAGFKG